MSWLRIVGGKHRGRKIRVPPGAVRPTTDRVRESLFNILDHRFGRPCHGARVLDLFAGSGALGLEAASRGAASVVLIEQNPKTAATTRQNTKGFASTSVVNSPAERFLDGPPQPFDLVFLDPPYEAGLLAPTLAKLAVPGWLADDALVCVEHPAASDPAAPGWTVAFERRFGATGITVLQRSET